MSKGENDSFSARNPALQRSHAGREALQADSPVRGNLLPAALPLASLRALFWKSHPLYLGRERWLPSPATRSVSRTAIHRRASADADGGFSRKLYLETGILDLKATSLFLQHADVSSAR